MANRSRSRRGSATSGVAAPPRVAAQALPPNIAALIESGGEITIGALYPITCAAVASDDSRCLAMLQRRPGETLQRLLERLDAAIDLAWTTDEFTDEINPPPAPTKRTR